MPTVIRRDSRLNGAGPMARVGSVLYVGCFGRIVSMAADLGASVSDASPVYAPCRQITALVAAGSGVVTNAGGVIRRHSLLSGLSVTATCALTSTDRWLTTDATDVYAPGAPGEVAKLHGTTLAVVWRRRVLASVAWAVWAGSYLYCFDGAGRGAVLDANGGALSTFAAPGVVGPVAAVVDSNGYLAVACRARGQIIRFNLAAPTAPVVVSVSAAAGGINDVAADGTVATDAGQLFTPWRQRGVSVGDAYKTWSTDTGVVTNGDPVVLMSGTSGNTITRMRASGSILTAAPSAGAPTALTALWLRSRVWIAFGGTYVAITQDDGDTWSVLDPLPSSAGTAGVCAASENGMLVVVAGNVSVDGGFTWSAMASPGNNPDAVAVLGAVICAYSPFNALRSDTNGASWTSQSAPGGSGGAPYAVRGQFVWPSGNGSFWTSPDATTWTNVGSWGGSQPGNVVYASGAYYLFSTISGTLYRSVDLAAWSSLSTTQLTSYNLAYSPDTGAMYASRSGNLARIRPGDAISDWSVYTPLGLPRRIATKYNNT